MASKSNDYTVAVPPGNSLEIRTGSSSGSVTVLAEKRTDVLITASHPASRHPQAGADGSLDLSDLFRSSTNLVIRCPEGADLLAGTASGKIRSEGRIGRLRATTASGSVTIDRARVAEVRTVSGNIEVNEVADLARLHTRSGSIQAGSVTIAEIATVSGRITVGRVESDIRVHTASGRVTMSTSGLADVRTKTISGQVTIIVPPGTRPDARLRSVRGRTACNCEPGDDSRILCQSVSGKIEVVTT